MQGKPTTKGTWIIVLAALMLMLALNAAEARAQEGPLPPRDPWAIDRPDDSGGTIDLGWSASPTPDIAEYRIYRSTRPGGPYACVGKRSTERFINYLGYTDVGLLDGTAYYYVATAVDYRGRESGFSPEVTAIPAAQKAKAAVTVQKSMVISLADQKLYCMENGELVYMFLVSTGTYSYPTPTGDFRILYHDQVHPVPKYPGCVCYYWMGFYEDYAIHAWPTYNGVQGNYSSLGHPASHGCVRLDPTLAHIPYYWAPDGTPLSIIPGPFQQPLPPISGGHVSMGSPNASDTWYFAEGYTGGGFDEYVLVFNPQAQAVELNMDFMLPDGSTQTNIFNVAPNSRLTFHVDSFPGMGETDVSVRLRSDLPVVAERAMYFDYHGEMGGHVATGVNQPSKTWYFAEGYTGSGFDEYVLVFNPQAQQAEVTFDFMKPDGSVYSQVMPVGAKSRATMYVDSVPGMEETDVSVRLRSDLPVVAERAMYFGYPQCPGGHVSQGVNDPGDLRYFAEGYTSEFYDTYVLLMNPGDNQVPAVVTFCKPTGERIEQPLMVAAHTRASLLVNQVPGLSSSEFSIRVEAGGPLVVERAMYFNFPR